MSERRGIEVMTRESAIVSHDSMPDCILGRDTLTWRGLVRYDVLFVIPWVKLVRRAGCRPVQT